MKDKRFLILVGVWVFMGVAVYSAITQSSDKTKVVATDMEDFYDDDVNPHIGYGIGMSGKGGMSYDGWVLTEDGIEPGMGF